MFLIVSLLLLWFQWGSSVYLCYKKSVAKTNMIAYKAGKRVCVRISLFSILQRQTTHIHLKSTFTSGLHGTFGPAAERPEGLIAHCLSRGHHQSTFRL